MIAYVHASEGVTYPPTSLESQAKYHKRASWFKRFSYNVSCRFVSLWLRTTQFILGAPPEVCFSFLFVFGWSRKRHICIYIYIYLRGRPPTWRNVFACLHVQQRDAFYLKFGCAFKLCIEGVKFERAALQMNL